jgi:putative flavoprotein involved in K+ transport
LENKSHRSIDAIVIGAGHAGLAMSKCLADLGIEHVVLERGEIANSWKTERWDSLHLLTPNWQSRLPGYAYTGDDPDGFRTMPETIAYIEGYARATTAPVIEDAAVGRVRAAEGGYEVQSRAGDFTCRAVVVASGSCNIPRLPNVADDLPAGIMSLSAMHYRRPEQIDEGGVMVVGASASGTQIAWELQKAGRQVLMAVGEHVRAPRRYRGLDLQWWMDQAGIMDERYDEVEDVVRARTHPSLQLTGNDRAMTLDLNTLADIGVRFVGRLAGFVGSTGQFSGSLRNMCALSDLKMTRLLNHIDEWAESAGLGDLPAPHRLEPTRVEDDPPLMLNLEREQVRTVIWASGFRPDYSWLEVDVIDAKGRLRHDGGVVDAPGLYQMGQQFLRRRKSSLIDGAGDDAHDLAVHLAGYLGGSVSHRSPARFCAGAAARDI